MCFLVHSDITVSSLWRYSWFSFLRISLSRVRLRIGLLGCEHPHHGKKDRSQDGTCQLRTELCFWFGRLAKNNFILFEQCMNTTRKEKKAGAK